MVNRSDLAATAEVAEILGRSVATVNRWAKDGKLRPVAKAPGIRGPYLFDRAEIARFKTGRHS
ncbi:helix-turn-helix domain-containing protein [Jatrophihabitans sp. DSM 45814]